MQEYKQDRYINKTWAVQIIQIESGSLSLCPEKTYLLQSVYAS